MPRSLSVLFSFLFLMTVVLVEGVGATDRGNPFGPRVAPQQQTADGAGSSHWMPAPMQGLLSEVARVQRDLNAALTREIRAVKGEDSLGAAAAIVLIAFLYGVFHAAGPGHGKMVVTSYFLAREAPVRRGILISILICLVQAASAIVIVALFALVLGSSRMEVVGHSLSLETVSYALVVLLGLYMSYGAIRGAHCHHDHAPGERAREGWRRRLRQRFGEMPFLAVAVGIRPCTGAIVVLLFTLANGILAVGVVATLFMALGVAATVSVFGLLAIYARRSLSVVTTRRPALYAAAMRSVSVTGSLLVLTMGTVLFLGALQRGSLL